MVNTSSTLPDDNLADELTWRLPGQQRSVSIFHTLPSGCGVRHCDVLVIGGGGAGLAAASAAAELGRSVVLLEKNPTLGGSTALSVGSVTTSNSPHQREQGIKDSPADHWEDFGRFSGSEIGRDNRELAWVLVENAPATFDWLLSTGLRFVGPMPEPPHRRPRMHNVLPSSKAFPYHLGRHCRSLGVEIEFGASVRGLLVQNGRVQGVVGEANNSQRTAWIARGGVVLAAGDFSAGADLKSHFASARAAAVEPLNRTSTGDGIVLGLAAGGVVVNGDHLRGPFMRFVPPPSGGWLQRIPPHRAVTAAMSWGFRNLPAWVLRPALMRFITTSLAPEAALYRAGAILVDKQGKLIDMSSRSPHEAVADAPGGCAYIVFDRKVAERFSRWPNYVSTAPGVAYAYLDDYRRTRPDLFHTARTVTDLAARIGVPANQLDESLRAAQDSGTASVSDVPLFALGPAKAYIVFTNGGLKVSQRLEVLRPDGSPVPGLYAAGSNGQGGLLLEGHGHHLMWAFVSGRLAGRHAAFGSTSDLPMQPG